MNVNSIFNVENKVAVITGGRRGLGKAMAIGLAGAGARIAVIAKSPDAKELEDSLSAFKSENIYISADLSDRSERKLAIEKVINHYGRIDILVNNAGVQHREAVLEYSHETWDYDLNLMLTAVFELSQYAAIVMKKQGGGKIIQLASISSFQSARFIAGYATVKHGLVGLTKSLSNELASSNINVNAIAPGLFNTDMATHVTSDPAHAEALKGRIPAGRFGEPEDIVGPLLFLASDASKHVHGHVLIVDGGWMGR